MASNDEYYVDGTPVSDLRVVDLKEQLEKRGLSKSGSKGVLLKRLKDQLAMEKLQAEQAGKDPSTAPNMEMKTCGNDFVAEYLEKQQQMLQAARMAGARPAAGTLESPISSSSENVSTPATPDTDRPLSSPTRREKSSRKTKSPRQSTSEKDVSVVAEPQPAPVEPETSASMTATTDTIETVPADLPATAEEAAEPVGIPVQISDDAVTIDPEKVQPQVVADIPEQAETDAAVIPDDTGISVVETKATVDEQEEKPPEPVAAEQQMEIGTVDSGQAGEAVSDEVAAGGDESAAGDGNKMGGEEGVVAGSDDDDKDEKENVSAAPSPITEDDGVDQDREDNDRIADVVEEKKTPIIALPVQEPDDVEMEISAPINAADEILEAVNTAPTTTIGGRKVSSTNEDSLPGIVSGTVEALNQSIPQRKRKWVAATRTKRTPVSISSDSLKDIVGSISDKVIQAEESAMVMEEEEAAPIPPKRIVITRELSDDNGDRVSVDAARERRVEIDVTRPAAKLTEDGFIRVSSPSPARHPPSNIIHVRGLTRPFTLQALHELFAKYGDFNKEEFWIDGIKSHCIVKYSNEEEATLARDRLHNIQWPSSNSKCLRVEFATQEDLDRNRSRDAPRSGPASREHDKTTEGPRDSRRVERDDRGRRSVSPRQTRDRDRSWDRGKTWRAGESPPTDPRGAGARRRGSLSPDRRGAGAKPDQPAPPAKLLDELFRKTKAVPCIYWLPLSEDQIREKEHERKKREQERQERMKRVHEEDRDRRREPYRRYSPYRGRRR